MAANYGRTSSSKVTQLPGTVRRDGNEPPGSDQLETRVRALEDKFEKVDGKLDAISRDLASLKSDLSYLKGKVDAMPTTPNLTVSLSQFSQSPVSRSIWHPSCDPLEATTSLLPKGRAGWLPGLYADLYIALKWRLR